MESSSDNFKNSLENTAKLIGLIGGVCYATGLFITLIDFSQYGLFAVDFLSPQYILTGAIFYFLIFGSILLNFLFRLNSVVANGQKKRRPDLPSARIFLNVCSLLIWSIIMLCIGNFFFQHLSVSEKIKMLGYYLLLTIPIITLINLNVRLEKLEKPSASNNSGNENRIYTVRKFDLHNTIAVYFTMLFIGSIFIYIYSTTLYKYLPSSFGGGRFSQISLTIKTDDYNSDLKNMIVLKDSIHNVPIKFDLVKESTFEYYILLSRNPNKVIQIPKRIVQGAIITEE